MNITRTIFLLLLLPGFAPEISGQQTSYTNDPIINDDGKNGYSRWEGVFLHTDRNEYVAGEYIWYAAYLINPGIESTKGKRNTAYVELLNFDNEPVVQKTIGIADGSGHGCFIIPDTLSSGSYILRSYTNYMKNFSPEQCFMKVINIYNTFSDRKFTSVSLNGERPGPGLILSPGVFKQPGVFNQNKGTEVAGYRENSLAEADRTGSLIRVQTKESFKRREKITVELYADSGLVTSGNYARMSISVSAPERQESSGDITGYASILRSILPEIKAEKNGSRELKLGSEENGRLLYGRVVSRNLHVSVPDNIVILSVPGKEARFQYAVTDSNGNFSFQIDIDSLERDVVLQVVENPGNALIMISSPFWESYPGFGRNPDTFISGVPPYIEDWSINYQVARVYGTRPSIDSPVPGKSIEGRVP